MTDSVRLGALAWPQYTDWAALLRVGQRVDELGYDALWTWDHPYPIRGDVHGPSFEGYLTLAGWAGVTTRVTLGHMVTANPLRNPAMLAKIVTTLDHMSNGRAILGIGGGWNTAEFEAFGVEAGRSMGQRLEWLDEAVELVRAMFDGREASARGPQYTNRSVRNRAPAGSERDCRSSSAARASAGRFAPWPDPQTCGPRSASSTSSGMLPQRCAVGATRSAETRLISGGSSVPRRASCAIAESEAKAGCRRRSGGTTEVGMGPARRGHRIVWPKSSRPT